jgi:transposase
MRTIREILRLKHECRCSTREISKSCDIGKSTVNDYLNRAKAAGLSWPLPDDLSDTALEQRLFPSAVVNVCTSRFIPDFHEIHKELQSRKHVTLNLLWQEYKEQHPEGYQYSWFCHSYRDWTTHLDVVMRHEHRAGEKLFVDYAGQTVPIVDGNTGEISNAQVFIAVMGASNYTYAEATSSQQTEDWIGSHVRAFAYFGGVPEIVVPDNLKSGISKACRYEPEINPTYNDLARHYQTVVIPARVRKPKDKAKAEAGVLLVERWILARLRKHTFFRLVDLNREIWKLLKILNSRSFKKLPGTRESWFEEIDGPALKSLPVDNYELAYWKKATVNLDYHVEVTGYYYSVPHTLAKKKLDIRYTKKSVECFYNNQRVASHLRKITAGRHSTIKEHMPISHQKYHEWTPERFKRWAAKIGNETAMLAELLLLKKAHPQQAYRSLLGILRLGKDYGNDRLEAACKRALYINSLSYKSIESILKNGLDQKAVPEVGNNKKPIQHKNIRGPGYYKPTTH